MLTVLAFRNVAFSTYGRCLNAFFRYLLYLKQTQRLLLPCQPHLHGTILTFDYASVDFYTHVFPFLEKNQIPAVVGVAWRYVAPESAKEVPLSLRIAPNDTLAFQDEIFSQYHPFCTVQELKGLQQSPYIQLASSGFAVRNLIKNPPYLNTEIFLSQKLMLTHLGEAPRTFLYPFGKYDKSCAAIVKQYYSHSFILGQKRNFLHREHQIFRLDHSYMLRHTAPIC